MSPTSASVYGGSPFTFLLSFSLSLKIQPRRFEKDTSEVNDQLKRGKSEVSVLGLGAPIFAGSSFWNFANFFK